MNIFSSLADNVFLSDVNIAGTHDSATAFVAMENAARCQDKTIKQQLDMGVRLLDIRLSKNKNEFYLVHALADCFSDKEKTKRLTFGEVLSCCNEFLRQNPNETLILSIKQDRGIMSKSFFPAFYQKYIKGNENKWYLENKVPTLSECRGKIVLMRRCKVTKKYKKKTLCGLDFSHWRDQVRKREKALTVVLNKDSKALVQDRYTLSKEVKWRCSKKYLDSFKASYEKPLVHFISTSVKTQGTLVGTAEYINKEFMTYPLKKQSGWILCDFPTNELIEKIILSNTEQEI